LSDQVEVNADELARFIPDNSQSNLPKLLDGGNGPDNFSEREILYKIMFDLKNDMNELKKFVLQMAKSNNLSTDSIQNVGQVTNHHMKQLPQNYDVNVAEANASREAVLIRENEDFSETEEVEETHSLADMEKMMIIKSLEKFKGKRKNAADELGISERTLYRKIKEYEINL
jgi:DNA-binding NtrC family response regulator